MVNGNNVFGFCKIFGDWLVCLFCVVWVFFVLFCFPLPCFVCVCTPLLSLVAGMIYYRIQIEEEEMCKSFSVDKQLFVCAV